MRIVVTGTDTGIGKTVFAAGLMRFLGVSYWKPVQAGLDQPTDSETVLRLGAVSSDLIQSEAYRLQMPASPHQAAEAEGITIDPKRLIPPSAPVVIEGAGGVMVPLTRQMTFLDVFETWRLPVILCARTQLGTINHTLLSLDAMRRRGVSVLGIAFIGEDQPETLRIIAEMGQVRILGRLPVIPQLEPDSLCRAFPKAFADGLKECGLQPASTLECSAISA